LGEDTVFIIAIKCGSELGNKRKRNSIKE